MTPIRCARAVEPPRNCNSRAVAHPGPVLYSAVMQFTIARMRSTAGIRTHHLPARIARAGSRAILTLGTTALIACATPNETALEGQSAQAIAEMTAPIILFKGNTGNGGAEVHHSYRIPAIVNAGDGRLVAVAEGRVDSAADEGNINLVMRRSLDNGATWLDQVQIWNAPDRLGTIGNPTLVYDALNDRVWLFASENDSKHSLGGAGGLIPVGVGDRRTWARYSDTKGSSWSDPVNLTSFVTPADYTWDAMGPGAGIQMIGGAKAGRLVIPAKGRIIVSDNAGGTWTSLPTNDAPLNETTVSELQNPAGGLYVNARSQDPDVLRRQIKRSSDDGRSWSAWASDAALLEKPCEASVLKFTPGGIWRTLFFNPASTVNRIKMRVRISYDGGVTWPISREVDAGQGGYSSMAATSDSHIAALYESGGGDDDFLDIKFTKFNVSWILNGAAEPAAAALDRAGP